MGGVRAWAGEEAHSFLGPGSCRPTRDAQAAAGVMGGRREPRRHAHLPEGVAAAQVAALQGGSGSCAPPLLPVMRFWCGFVLYSFSGRHLFDCSFSFYSCFFPPFPYSVILYSLLSFPSCISIWIFLFSHARHALLFASFALESVHFHQYFLSLLPSCIYYYLIAPPSWISFCSHSCAFVVYCLARLLEIPCSGFESQSGQFIILFGLVH